MQNENSWKGVLLGFRGFFLFTTLPIKRKQLWNNHISQQLNFEGYCIYRIHPRDKEDIAVRLALAARGVAYGENVNYQGPFPSRFSLNGNQMIIEFDNGNGNLEVKSNDGFEVKIDLKSYGLKSYCKKHAICINNPTKYDRFESGKYLPNIDNLIS